MVYLRSISDGGFMMLPITFCAIVVVALAGWTALRTKVQDPYHVLCRSARAAGGACFIGSRVAGRVGRGRA